MSTLILTGITQDKSKVEILQKFVAFLEYMNFMMYIITTLVYMHISMKIEEI